MNRNDIILIVIICLIIILLLITYKPSNSNTANVYYDNKLIKKILLDKDDNYIVNGENGPVYIMVKNKKIKVTNETSPLHLCQNTEIEKKGEAIICLPNKIVIKIEDDELDGIVR